MAFKKVAIATSLFIGCVVTSALAYAAHGYAAASVNLRAGPGTQYPPIVVVPSGAPVTIFGCLNGYR